MQLAITGMDVVVGGGCDGLDAFENVIYTGQQLFIAPPVERLNVQAALKGAFIEEFEVDLALLGINPQEFERISPGQLLSLKVAQRALTDAGLNTDAEAPSKVAVLVASENQQGRPAAAAQLARFLGLSAPALDLSPLGNCAAEAAQQAQSWLAGGSVEAVLFVAVSLIDDLPALLKAGGVALGDSLSPGFDHNARGWRPGEGAAALVFQPVQAARRAYAWVEAVAVKGAPSPTAAAFFPAFASAEVVHRTCQQALAEAGISPRDVGYLEAFASGLDALDAAEIEALNRAYRSSGMDLTLAMGSVQANLGYAFAAAGAMALIRAALCLYHRFIPAVPGWSAPKMPHLWQGGPFYFAAESRPWFLQKGVNRRIAAISTFGRDASYAHWILTEPAQLHNRTNRALAHIPFYLFPLTADSQAELLQRLDALQRTLVGEESLQRVAAGCYEDYQKRQQARYCLALVGHHPSEIQREIHFARQGIPTAFERNQEWQTPMGSYFTPEPLGGQGAVAFVYPGAFNSYVGLGQDLFYLFPQIYEKFIGMVSDVGSVIGEKLLYPRSLAALSKDELNTLDARLKADPIAMLTSGTSLAVVYTHILRDVFGVQPRMAFGYSLGENSMLFAADVWTHGDEMNARLNQSPLFHTRLSGPQNAVRAAWGLSPESEDYSDPEFWANYLLMADPARVRQQLAQEEHVYLTHVNTPRQVVIGGEKAACQRVIAALKCTHLQAPFNYALHCEAIRSEYPLLAELHHWPVHQQPEITLYSAADYQPLPIEQDRIADSIGRMLSTSLDFPRLIERVYQDGARLFVEVGAGSNCAKWIADTLKDRPHFAASINRQGSDDHSSILRLLARLSSQRVPLNLTPLYQQPPSSAATHHAIIRRVRLADHQPEGFRS